MRTNLHILVPEPELNTATNTGNLGNHYMPNHNFVLSTDIDSHLPPFLKRRKRETRLGHIKRCCRAVNDKRIKEETRALLHRCCWLLAIIEEENLRKKKHKDSKR